MKILLLLLITFLTTAGKSQFLERIYLKDSITTYTGWVTEQKPQEYIRLLRLKERDTVQIESGKILKIVRVIDTTSTDNPFPLKKPVTVTSSKTILKRNDIYLEVAGAGGFGTVNYERQLTKASGLGVRLGVGFYTEKAFYLTIPVGINYLFPLPNKMSFIDAGLNVTWFRINGKLFSSAHNLNSDHFVSFIPNIGYRKHTRRNLMWRISLASVINNDTFIPWLGFSLGKRF